MTVSAQGGGPLESGKNPCTRVLLIEDDETDAMWLGRALAGSRFRSFELKVGTTLQEGLACLKNEKPDFVICDLGLPDASGLQSYEAVRKAAPELPVIVLTGNTSDENLGREAVKLGAQDYLIKGVVTPDGFLRAIDYSFERKQALLLRDEFVHMVSHELRNPLAILKEVISQLFDFSGGNLTETQKELLGLFRSAVDRLLRTTSDLLDVAKMESGKAELRVTDFDLVELVRELGRFFEGASGEKGLELRMGPFPAKALIHADRDAIARLITNLLNNALKYTENGFIHIAVAETQTHWQCRVSDSGIGISAGDLSMIFNRYQQFGKPALSAEKGVGLGLSICKEIAERHGGWVEVQSQPGKGSAFTLNLPKESGAE